MGCIISLLLKKKTEKKTEKKTKKYKAFIINYFNRISKKSYLGITYLDDINNGHQECLKKIEYLKENNSNKDFLIDINHKIMKLIFCIYHYSIHNMKSQYMKDIINKLEEFIRCIDNIDEKNPIFYNYGMKFD